MVGRDGVNTASHPDWRSFVRQNGRLHGMDSRDPTSGSASVMERRQFHGSSDAPILRSRSVVRKAVCTAPKARTNRVVKGKKTH